ncbi:MAG: ABC transporter ATP-binding protein/permease [Acidobacteriota bacterium]|nr:ABC transporter ATP-binding protein/permease [Acidobacteriota bacterium]
MLLLFVALLGVGVEVAKPLPLKIIIDNVLANQTLPALFAQFFENNGASLSKEYLLVWTIGLAILLAIGSAVVSMLVSGMTISIAQRLVYDFSLEIFNKLQQLSLSYYGRNQVGDLLHRVNADVYVVYFVVAQIALPVIISLVSLCAMFYVMVQLNPTLSLIAAAVIPLLAASLLAFSKPLDTTTTRQYQTQGELMAFMQQSLSAVKVVQGFARERFMHGKLAERAMEFSNAYKIANQVSLGYGQVATLITALAAAVMLGFGARNVLGGNLSIGDLFVFLGYLGSLYGLVNSLTVAIGTSITIGARGRRVFEILDSNEVISEKPNAARLENVRGEIAFENVTFGYKNETGEIRTILRDINFSVMPGQITALVGATGAGKTSLVSLLSRFYDALAGRILIDGIDITDVQLNSLRENISLVLQEPFLFPVSIADNIAFGRPDATREEIVEAAKFAQADEFISRLPEGYDTVISESGASLSGGERQRISIARALLKNAPILVLDEPTSALDAHTEAQIFKALENLMIGRTTFIISHRLSTIKRADQIITLKDGRIVERGTHESLLSAGKVYANLYRHQHIAAM